MSELADLIRSGAGVTEIAAHLDSLTFADRVDSLWRLSRSDQRALYAAAAESPPLDVAFFTGRADAPAHHIGANTLPLPRRLRRFEKRFAPAGDRLHGYNEWKLRRLIGPGYFVAVASGGDERGGVVIDYTQVPDRPVPAGWPRVVPNSRGLQRFVYDGTRDFMRRVSGDVSIGAAHRGERALDYYFTLCRPRA